jgi:hypothetical protein
LFQPQLPNGTRYRDAEHRFGIAVVETSRADIQTTEIA